MFGTQKDVDVGYQNTNYIPLKEFMSKQDIIGIELENQSMTNMNTKQKKLGNGLRKYSWLFNISNDLLILLVYYRCHFNIN